MVHNHSIPSNDPAGKAADSRCPLVVAVLAAVTVALTAGARREWLRARQAERVTGTA